MVIIGTIAFGLGGMIFTIPLLFFFISSSIFSYLKTPGKVKSLVGVGKTGPRDFWQVMANGGVGALLTTIYVVTGDIIWFFPYLASLCEAAADTWATELGTLIPDSPVSIISFRGVEPGQSGGISILGTLAAIGGALLTMLVASSTGFVIKDLLLFDMKIWQISAGCGLAGALLDSVLGASLQAQYQCKSCHIWTERRSHCDQPAVLVRGLRFVNNDVVNFTCALLAALIASVIFSLR